VIQLEHSERYCRSCRKTTPHQKEVGVNETGVLMAILTYSIILPWIFIAELAGRGIVTPVLNFGILKPHCCRICGEIRYF